MHGNVDRTDVHVDNALNFVFGDIRKRDIVPEQKRQTRIVILKVQTFTHTFRQLVDKAENAFIFAVLLLVH